MDSALAALEAAYCPAIDPALLTAIALDFDLTSPDEYRQATEQLDAIKTDAELQEAAGFDGFDPSGTGGAKGDSPTDDEALDGARTASRSARISDETEASSLSNAVSSLDLDAATQPQPTFELGLHDASPEQIEALDEDSKVQALVDVFGAQLGRRRIVHTLRKCQGKWAMALEDLLNQAFLKDEGVKGVDGFAEEVVGRGRKAKRKGQRARVAAREGGSGAVSPAVSPDEGSPAPTPVGNRWKDGSEEIDFVANRTGIPRSMVSSFYQKHNYRLPQTISALLKVTKDDPKVVKTDSETVDRHAHDLGRDFPSIEHTVLTALIRLTYPFTSYAHELAKALTTKPRSPTGTNGTTSPTQLIPQMVPLDLSDADSDASWTSVASRKRRAGAAIPAIPDAYSVNATIPANAATIAMARAHAIERASAAHRASKSLPLQGAVAGFYAQEARDYGAKQQAATAATADALTGQNSTRNSVDLHGVDVVNGVRIACERVEAWWDGLGEAKVNGRMGAEARGEGFRVVVGMGRHSEGGKGKLGPAVGKALRGEGWRVEVSGGALLVHGPVRR